MDHTLPELTRSTTSYIYKEDGTIIQTVDKIVYDKSHLPPEDFLSFINVESYKVSNTTDEKSEVMTPNRRPYNPSERATDEPQKRKGISKKKPDI